MPVDKPADMWHDGGVFREYPATHRERMQWQPPARKTAKATTRVKRVYVNLTHTPNLLRPLLPAGTSLVELHEVAIGRTPGTDVVAQVDKVLAKLDADAYLTDRAVCSAAKALAKITMKLYTGLPDADKKGNLVEYWFVIGQHANPAVAAQIAVTFAEKGLYVAVPALRDDTNRLRMLHIAAR